MPYIQRELQPQITRETPPKAVVIFGARQIGKTTLLTELSQYEKSVRWFNGDLITDHRQLQFSSSTDVELTLRQADTIIIDEAQRFPNIGLILKQLVDVNVRLNLGKKIFATGSSSLELAKGVKESAVGRLVHRQPKISGFGAVDDVGKRPISLWHKQTPGILGVDFYPDRLYNIL